ncbi:PilZ domain-containing protein [bacterium]|nr:PilZ domain-containing protein [bacterium]
MNKSKQPLNHAIDMVEKPKIEFNRRIKGDRLETFFPIYITSLSGDLIQGYAESINLSWSGILIETNILLEKDDVVFLEFTLPDTDQTIVLKAKVVRVRSEEDLEYHVVGFIFKEMDVNIRRMLNGYILEHLDAQ